MSEVLAKGVFDTLIDALSALGYTYDLKNALALSFTAGGNDIPMHFNVTVDADKKIDTSGQQAFLQKLCIFLCKGNVDIGELMIVSGKDFGENNGGA